MQRGKQGKFFKNRPNSSSRLKGPTARLRKCNYPLISMHLNCKDCRRFWQNGLIIAIFAGSPKTHIFWKSAKGGPREIFQKSPQKNILPLKGSKAFWRKCHYPLISMHLNWKEWKRFWRKQGLQKCPNGQVIAIFASSPKTRIFWKSTKGVPKEISQKSPKK